MSHYFQPMQLVNRPHDPEGEHDCSEHVDLRFRKFPSSSADGCAHCGENADKLLRHDPPLRCQDNENLELLICADCGVMSWLERDLVEALW
jgi:hypothetical protein